jgi:hypothetical protein
MRIRVVSQSARNLLQLLRTVLKSVDRLGTWRRICPLGTEMARLGLMLALMKVVRHEVRFVEALDEAAAFAKTYPTSLDTLNNGLHYLNMNAIQFSGYLIRRFVCLVVRFTILIRAK